MPKRRGKKVKGFQPKAGQKIQISPSSEAENSNSQTPVFCFQYLHQNYGLDICENDDKVALLNALVKRSKMTWQQIAEADKHGLGSETIGIDALGDKALPAIVTSDVKKLTALRFNGLKAMIGLRKGRIYHLLFLDPNFKVYDHGS